MDSCCYRECFGQLIELSAVTALTIVPCESFFFFELLFCIWIKIIPSLLTLLASTPFLLYTFFRLKHRTSLHAFHCKIKILLAIWNIRRLVCSMQIPGPPPAKGSTVEHQKQLGLWAVKLPSSDAIVVRRTLASLTEHPHGLPGHRESDDHIEKRKSFWSTVKPAHFGVKIGTKSLFGLVKIILTGISIGLFGATAFGRTLLLKYPAFFTGGMFRKTGPTEEEVNSATFKMWFVAQGFGDASVASSGRKPDTEIVTRVSGPEIGYITTPIILVQCALTLLEERANLPKGGVYPPGIVFGPTDLQQRLQQNGISFDFISKKTIPA